MSSYELALKVRIFTEADIKQLEKGAQTEKRRDDRPEALPFRDIQVATKCSNGGYARTIWLPTLRT